MSKHHHLAGSRNLTELHAIDDHGDIIQPDALESILVSAAGRQIALNEGVTTSSA